jgi:hypothetical protein
MKLLRAITSITAFSFICVSAMAQHDAGLKEYKHKVVVDSIIQTKAYTYLKVKEVFAGKDSIIWLALPSFEPTVGATYYHDGGLEMGTFHSKELNRDFNPIVFSSFVSTSSEVSDKNILPKPAVDTIPVDATPPALHTVLIKEVLEAGGYTYLRADENNKEVWLAIVKANIIAGNIYTYEDAAPMKNFKSRELNRTFDEVLFVAKLTLKGDSGARITDKKKIAEEKKANTLAEKGNVSLSDLYKYKDSFVGKTIRISGTVTRFNENILGKNWIHVEDGTLKKNPTDIIVTIDDQVKIGDKVICEGQITTDRDFGSGYKFEIMMENAKIIR